MDTFGGSERVCEQNCRPLQFYGHFWAITVFATKTANACSFMDSFQVYKKTPFIFSKHLSKCKTTLHVLQATAVNKISHQYLYCIVRDRKYILQSYPSLVEELSVCLEGRVHHYEVGT